LSTSPDDGSGKTHAERAGDRTKPTRQRTGFAIRLASLDPLRSRHRPPGTATPSRSACSSLQNRLLGYREALTRPQSRDSPNGFTVSQTRGRGPLFPMPSRCRLPGRDDSATTSNQQTEMLALPDGGHRSCRGGVLRGGRSRIGVEEVQLLAAWEEARATRDGRGTLGIRTARAAEPAPMRVDWQQAPASFCLGCAVAESHRCRMQVRGSKGLCLTLDVVAPSVTKRLQGS